MHSLVSIAGATYGEIARRPFYYITLGVFAVLIYCSHFLTQFTFFREVNTVREMGMASIALWGFITVVVLSGPMITQELEDRTAVTLLSKPIRRSAFLVGKYLGMMLATFLGMLVLAGVLFFTLWWMAKSDLFGHPALALECLVAGLTCALAGTAYFAFHANRARLLERATAQQAPRGPRRLGLALVVLGCVLLILAAEFSVGTLSKGDAAHYRLYQQERGDYTVWTFVGSFMDVNGTIVLQGFLLSFLQVAILGSICVSLSAFMPPVVSVAATAFLFLLGNLSTYMLGSIERLNMPAVSLFGRAVYYLLPNLAYFNLQTHFSEGRIISLGYLSLALLHASLYTMLVFSVSCALFERREIR